MPNLNIVLILSDKQSAFTGAAVNTTYETGKVEEVLKLYASQWMVHVQDTARVHVAAFVDPEVENQRILVFAHPFNFNDVLAALRKLEPGREWPGDVEGLRRDLSKLDNGPGAELLKKSGREVRTSLEKV